MEQARATRAEQVLLSDADLIARVVAGEAGGGAHAALRSHALSEGEFGRTRIVELRVNRRTVQA